MKEDRIYIKDWLIMKPYESQSNTDLYYLRLSNDIYDLLKSRDFKSILESLIDYSDFKMLAVFLASYFEDIISETGIWTAFVTKHKALYDKYLPFYDTPDYYKGEINEEDVSFLIWYFINTMNEDIYFRPQNILITLLSSDVMQILEDKYETAPENSQLKACYQLDSDDYYDVRTFIGQVLFGTYLFFPDAAMELASSEMKIIEEDDRMLNYDYKLNLLKENSDTLTMTHHTKLLSMKGKEWAAEILGEDHASYQSLKEMLQKITGYFLYKKQDEKYIYLEHIASGMKFSLLKKSYVNHANLDVTDAILMLGIVKWMGEWRFSGISMQIPFDANLVLDEKNSIPSRMQVSFLQNQEELQEVLSDQYAVFMKFNNNSPIAFMEYADVEAFATRFIEYHNDSLKLSKKEMEEAENRAKKDGYFGGEEDEEGFYDGFDGESALVFFNLKRGMEIVTGVNSAFVMEGNPFLDGDSKQVVLALLTSEDYSTELVHYFFEHCKDESEYLANHAEIEENLDFLLRFWKNTSYHTTPNVSTTG